MDVPVSVVLNLGGCKLTPDQEYTQTQGGHLALH